MATTNNLTTIPTKPLKTILTTLNPINTLTTKPVNLLMLYLQPTFLPWSLEASKSLKS